MIVVYDIDKLLELKEIRQDVEYIVKKREGEREPLAKAEGEG